MALKDRLSITEVAKSVGVTPRTIMRWEKSGKIKRSKRDWRGWRFYQKEDIDDIRKFFESSYEYDEAGKAGVSFSKDVLVALVMALGCALYTYIICGSAFAEGPSAATVGATTGKAAVSETSKSVDINLANLPAVKAPQLSLAEAMKYTLGPDDTIQVDVRRHPEFSGLYTVNAEGKIEYKFVGDVIVDGLTKVQLQERLAQILSEYILTPDVNVQITAFQSKVYYVVGEVNRPGKFYMKGNTVTIREALVQAGLPTQAASMRRCRLVSPSDKKKNQYHNVNAYELLYGGDLKENIDMKPGDILYVPSTIIAKIIHVISPITNTVSEAAGAAAAGAGVAAL